MMTAADENTGHHPKTPLPGYDSSAVSVESLKHRAQHEASRCPVCGSHDPITVVILTSVPALQLVLYPTRREAREAPLGTLDIDPDPRPA